MKSIDMVKNRYTTKSYDPSYKISDEIMENLQEILRYTPSAINAQPWRFTFITNSDVKNNLAEASKHNAKRIKDCSLLIVFSALTYAEFLKQFDKYAIEGAKVYYDKNMSNKSADEVENWIKNQIYLAMGFALSALGNDEVDSTALEGILPDEYEKILGIDTKKERVVLALAIGKRDVEDKNQPKINPKSRLEKEIIIREIL